METKNVSNDTTTTSIESSIERKFSSRKLFLQERDKELKQLMYAMLLGEHLFIKGPAGTGKSMLAKNAFSLVENANTFNIQMSEATLSEHLFGAYDIATWKNKGIFMRDISGSILEADFAFVDEIFDGREDVLRTLLGVLNERTFSEGRQQEEAKLHTCVATANYEEINEKTQPILDRFIFKAVVGPLKSKSNRMSMYKQHLNRTDKLGKDEVKPILTLEQLKNFNQKIYSNAVALEEEVLSVYDEMIKEFTKETDKYVSARTTNKLLDIVKASVLLDGRTKAEFKDLFEIKFGLCTMNETEEERKFDLVYKRCVESLETEKIQLKELEGVEKNLKKLTDFNDANLQPNEYISKVKALKTSISKLEKMDSATNSLSNRKSAILNQLKNAYNTSKNKFFDKNQI